MSTTGVGQHEHSQQPERLPKFPQPPAQDANGTAMSESNEIAAPAPAAANALLFCGTAKWDMVGRKSVPKKVAQRGGTDAGPELLAPTRLYFAGMPDVQFVAIYSGCIAAHAVLVDADGAAWGIGRNDNGQLAVDDFSSKSHPVRFDLPRSGKVVRASCGRTHTLVVLDSGVVFGCGSNALGRLGLGAKGGPLTQENAEWRKVVLPENAVDAATGADFSVFVGESGKLYCCGSGEYGQLGNGRTGERIETGNKTAFDIEVTPTKVSGFGDGEGEVPIKRVACGANHALALDGNGKVWSWGFGGYGRLGHKQQKDEMRPKILESFASPNYKLDVIACGQTSSWAAQLSRKSLWMWGMTKKSGEATMYPKPVFDLQGWPVRSISSGPTSTVVASDCSVISWGPAPTFGELGYGADSPKSSTKPKIIDSLEGLHVAQVVEGGAFTFMLVRAESEKEIEQIEKLPKHTFDAPPESADAKPKGNSKAKAGGTKRKATAGGRGKPKARKR